MKRKWPWVWVLLWMSIVFTGSTDLLSGTHTSRFLEPFLRWVFPGISRAGLEWGHLLVRKAGHLTEYGVLAALGWRALQPKGIHDPSRAASRYGLAFALCVAYACSDEYHQSFYPSRYASWGDVAIDSAGAALVLGWIWCRRSATGRGRHEIPPP
jgi:VanZ family protein